MQGPEFVDEATLHARGGRGGRGAVSFRREAFAPHGGPDGGDGGHGGDVVLVADPRARSLLDIHRRPHRRAGDGGHGEGADRRGADGGDLEVGLPVGTVVRDATTGDIRADLAAPGARFVAARGGRGGRGNASFATRARRAPRFAEVGEEPPENSYRLELKLIADVGLVGFPSAGKSSLIARLSAARPDVAAYPFTTVTPNLGVLWVGYTDVVLADVPGLIRGASQGRGLGHRFLRHIERCQALVHVLDCMPFDPRRDPLADLAVVEQELAAHDPALLERPALAALNKVDLPDGAAMASLVRPTLEERGYEVFEVSAVTGQGLEALRHRLAALVGQARGRTAAGARPDPGEEMVIRLEPSEPTLEVVAEAPGRFRVQAAHVERWVQMLPLDNPEAVAHLQERLRRAGVESALVQAGAREGDEVAIGEAVFDFHPAPGDLPASEMLGGEA